MLVALYIKASVMKVVNLQRYRPSPTTYPRIYCLFQRPPPFQHVSILHVCFRHCEYGTEKKTGKMLVLQSTHSMKGESEQANK
jgi:hypothetical protein